MANDMKTFEDIFVGTWEWDRDENLVEAMRKMGSPEEEISMYAAIKPVITFERRGDSVYMNFIITPTMNYDCQYKFNEEFETKDHLTNPPSFHNKETASLREDGVMTFAAKTQIKGQGKVDTYSEFFVKDGELHTPMSPLSDKSYNGNRIYKKVKNAKE